MSILLVAAVMVFAAGLNYRYVVGAILCALPAIYVVVMGSAYRRRRIRPTASGSRSQDHGALAAPEADAGARMRPSRAAG